MFILSRSKPTWLVLDTLVYGDLTDIVQKAAPSQIFQIFTG
jgi:hypothetical protein